MDVRVAKEYLHIRDWLALAQEIVDAGEKAYLGSLLAQEAGDSIMMKVGEAAGRLARAGEEPPEGAQWSDAISNRNWVIHQYDEIDRAVTWNTLSGAIPAWRRALAPRIAEAERVLADRRPK